MIRRGCLDKTRGPPVLTGDGCYINGLLEYDRAWVSALSVVHVLFAITLPVALLIPTVVCIEVWS